jgi:L-iditol 2-dehydrogenase
VIEVDSSAPTGTTMRADVLHEKLSVSVDEVPIPTVDADQVLVRVAAVGVCGSDVHYYREGRIGDFIVDQPMILGHESSGVIVAVGADVPADRIGERVAIEPQRACRKCFQCKHGRYNLCPYIEFYATPPIDGAFADYAVIQADYAFPIPDSMSLEAAALCEPLSVGIWANQKAGVGPGDRVLITGSGPIGVVAAQVARAFGAAEIIVSDPVAERRDLALKFGASRVIDPTAEDIATMDLEVDAYIDASGFGPAISSGITALRAAGTAVLVGLGAPDVPLPVGRIRDRELLITGVFRYTNTWPLAIELVASGKVDLDSLVTGRYGLDDVEAALQSTANPTTLKSLVVPSL